MIDAYRQYLIDRGYTLRTIQTYLRYTECFLAWVKESGLSIKQITYSDMLAWIRFLQDQQASAHYINDYLRSVRWFYRHLIETGAIAQNPAEELRLKGVTRKVPTAILTRQELLDLYEQYSGHGLSGKRNKCVVGFIVHQGLGLSALQHLQVSELYKEYF